MVKVSLVCIYFMEPRDLENSTQPVPFGLPGQAQKSFVFKSEFSGDKGGRKEFNKCVESIKMVLSIRIMTCLWLRNNIIL